MRNFFIFIREQGVVGLAIGFILGGAISKVVSALVTDIINPLIGILTGKVGGLKTAMVKVGTAQILYGDFIAVVVDFIVIALVIYFAVRLIGVDRLDKKKN